MTAYILLSILGFVIVLLSFPIRISAVHAPTIVTIHWALLKVLVLLEGNKTRQEYYFLGVKIKSGLKKERKKIVPKKKPKAKASPKKRQKKKKIRKITLEFIKEIAKHPLIRKILNKLINLIKRLIRSVKLHSLKADIGLDDYYWQGIIHGFSYNIQSDKIKINNNYLNQNHVELDLEISIWKVLSALMMFLLAFPYLKTFKFYKYSLLEK